MQNKLKIVNWYTKRQINDSKDEKVIGPKLDDLEKHLMSGVFRIQNETWNPYSYPIDFRSDHTFVLMGN